MALSGTARVMGLRQGVTILLLGLLMTAGLVGQERAPNRQEASIKGCLWATLQGTYQLAEDETGAVYNLIGSLESLRLLVGNDVVVGGHSLEAREGDAGRERGNEKSPRDVRYESDSPVAGPRESGTRGGTPSFLVLTAIKVSDLCALTSITSFTSAEPPTR